jgi:glycosyltransferase involved in cell wall biosynthesis
MSSPTVSIIVPCYRAQATIGATIASVLAQTFDDWECILVSDDGQSYLEILEGLGLSDRRIVEHPERSNQTGTVAPRNRGLPMARGSFVADLDADDLWAPDRLEQLVPHAHRHGWVQDVLECFTEASPIGFSGKPDGTVQQVSPTGILEFDFPFHTIVRRDLLDDQWFWHDSWVPDVLRAYWLACRTPMCWVRVPTLKYRVGAGSMSQSIDGSRKIDAAYDDILSELKNGGFNRIATSDRAACASGFERKRQLNLRYMDAVRNEPDPQPFLEWILDRRISGYRL